MEYGNELFLYIPFIITIALFVYCLAYWTYEFLSSRVKQVDMPTIKSDKVDCVCLANSKISIKITNSEGSNVITFSKENDVIVATAVINNASNIKIVNSNVEMFVGNDSSVKASLINDRIELELYLGKCSTFTLLQKD